MSTLVRLVPGTVFAQDFRVVRPLAEGGMGAVYVVEQLSTGKERALKIMHPQFVQDPRARERFAQEARISSRIESDHVVEVVAAGVDAATGTPWLAMELLKGETLDAFAARRGRLAPHEVLEVYRQLCHALAAAHRAGLVHRDLKPENIFLAVSRREGAAFVVKILDFGIAKLLLESRTAATVTDVIGSPLWMAPEQADRNGRVRPATDVWALGLIAFRLLTGALYWRSAHGESASIPTLMKELFIEPIEPASVRAAALGAGVPLPPGFDPWFARCVAREAEARFHDAGEALAALFPVLSGAAALPFVPATQVGAPPSVAPPTAPWNATLAAPPPAGASRGRPSALPWALAGVLGLAVVGGVAWALVAKPAPAPSPSSAPRETTPAPAPVASPPAPEAAPEAAPVAPPAPEAAPVAPPPAPEAAPAPERAPATPRRDTPRRRAPARPQDPRVAACRGDINCLMSLSTGRPQPQPAAPPGGELPETPPRAEVLRVMNGRASAVRACAGDRAGTATVAVVVASTGRVESARVAGVFAGTPAGECIAGVVRRAEFSRFRRPQFSFTYPYTIQPRPAGYRSIDSW